ncbi:hypothetical protein [Streptomyces atriruber]|uniref:hypothetical protein n=1 Tax=Streptomyces atriruber TaxID=545121 RepID=UPI0006E3C2BA|nr:hypothetical protein [Streptomyces atriruber]
MEMTESFATTAAAVAPVVLLAAAVEVAVYQKAVETQIKSIVRTASEKARESGSRQDALDYLTSAGGDLRRSALQTIAGTIWGFIMLGQALVTIGCLAWLSDHRDPMPWATPKLVTLIVGVGVLTVAVVPVLRLTLAPVTAFRAARAELRAAVREAGEGGEAGERGGVAESA